MNALLFASGICHFIWPLAAIPCLSSWGCRESRTGSTGLKSRPTLTLADSRREGRSAGRQSKNRDARSHDSIISGCVELMALAFVAVFVNLAAAAAKTFQQCSDLAAQRSFTATGNHGKGGTNGFIKRCRVRNSSAVQRSAWSAMLVGSDTGEANLRCRNRFTPFGS